jgi:hypothetical protein
VRNVNEINVDNVGGFGRNTKARAITLANTRVGDIPFPMRAITGTDLNHAQKVISVDSSLTIPFDSKVYGINRTYDKTRLMPDKSKKGTVESIEFPQSTAVVKTEERSFSFDLVAHVCRSIDRCILTNKDLECKIYIPIRKSPQIPLRLESRSVLWSL